MRGPFLLACFAVSMVCTPLHAVEFPYKAYASSDDVYVRSGPGTNYYPTAKLKRGEAVEVYRHDPGGWYAIRPPRQSFSWVLARQLDSAEAGVAVVNAERAVARVGSIFSDMRDVIQVRLNKGERVELAESQPVADGKWYKVVPPAGEFRWVNKEYLDRQAPEVELTSDDSDADEEDEDDEKPVRTRRKSRRPERDIQLTSTEADEDDEVAERQPRKDAEASRRRAPRRPVSAARHRSPAAASGSAPEYWRRT